MSALPSEALTAAAVCRVCDDEHGAGLCGRCIADRDNLHKLADQLAENIRTHALRVAGAHYEPDADVMTAKRELRAALLEAATHLGVTL